MSRRRYLRIACLGTLALALAALAACTPGDPQSTFDPTGPVARSQLNLFWWIFWAAVVVFVVVEAAIVYAAIRYRRRPGDGDPEQIHGHTPLEIGWTIVPAIILAVVAVPTVLTIFDNANSPEPGSMTVEVIGHQWWFEFRYPEYDFITANEMHIPLDEVVNISLDSVDVLHSFWIPKIAGKVDMIPNNINTMWIMGEESGVFLGQCAEFCGVGHANMRFRVVVEPRAEFDAWVQAQLTPAASPVDPLAADGETLFTPSGCGGCHTVDGLRGAVGTRGPNLTHVASRSHIASGIIENTQANLRAWITDPDKVKPGNVMGTEAAVYTNPDRRLTEPQISALVAYLRSLK